MGFCRTNLFKRLESSGETFQQSIERHVLWDHVFLHAIENNRPLPLDTQDWGLLDSGNYDEDVEDITANAELFEQNDEELQKRQGPLHFRAVTDFKTRAAEVYETYATQLKNRFKWLRSDLFVKTLAKDLAEDALSLINLLLGCGINPKKDAKVEALHELLTKRHPKEKVLVFTQFADTARYIEYQLRTRSIEKLAKVTGEDEDPTGYASRFSPESNAKRDRIQPGDELRVLIATDVLSEGQNLQDCPITSISTCLGPLSAWCSTPAGWTISGRNPKGFSAIPLPAKGLKT